MEDSRVRSVLMQQKSKDHLSRSDEVKMCVLLEGISDSCAANKSICCLLTAIDL